MKRRGATDQRQRIGDRPGTRDRRARASDVPRSRPLLPFARRPPAARLRAERNRDAPLVSKSLSASAAANAASNSRACPISRASAAPRKQERPRRRRRDTHALVRLGLAVLLAVARVGLLRLCEVRSPSDQRGRARVRKGREFRGAHLERGGAGDELVGELCKRRPRTSQQARGNERETTGRTDDLCCVSTCCAA